MLSITLLVVMTLFLGVFIFANVEVDEREKLFRNAIKELTRVIGDEQINELRLIYEAVFADKNIAETSFRDAIISIQMQASANNLTNYQIKSMFTGYIETTKAALTEDLMEWTGTPHVSSSDHKLEFGDGLPDPIYRRMPTPPMKINGTNIAIQVGHINVVFDEQPPMKVNGSVLVPARELFEAIGAEVEWNQSAQTVTATKGETVVVIQIGNPSIIVNGTNVDVDVMPQIRNNCILIPVRVAAEAFGKEVRWLHMPNIVLITTP